jgi:hypothetical protein
MTSLLHCPTGPLYSLTSLTLPTAYCVAVALPRTGLLFLLQNPKYTPHSAQCLLPHCPLPLMRSSRTVFHAGHCVTLASLLSPVSTALHAHCSIARGSRCLTALLTFFVTVPASRRRLSHTPGVLGLHVALYSCPTLKLPTVQLPRC